MPPGGRSRTAWRLCRAKRAHSQKRWEDTLMTKKAWLYAATLALALGSATAAEAGEKISIMVGGLEKIIYLPAKLAEQLGYFKAEGLDVELLSEPAGVDAEHE